MISKELILEEFRIAINTHQSIVEFRNSCQQMLSDEISDIMKDNAIGIKLSNIFDCVYKTLHATSNESNNEEAERNCLEATNNEKVTDLLSVKDIVSLDFVDHNEERQLVYSLLPAFKDDKNDPSQSKKKLELANRKHNLYVQSILSCIITSFESYFETVFRRLALFKPEKYFEKKTIPLPCLFNEDINKTVYRIIDEDIEGVFRDSISALETIKKNSSVDIDRYSSLKKELEEVNCRRNLYVHADGVVNNIYLSKVDKSLTKGLKEGQKLECDESYLDRSLELLKMLTCSLYCELLKHIKAKQGDFEELVNVGFKALVNGEFSIAEYVYTMLKRNELFDFENKTMCNVNYLIARQQQEKDISNDIAEFDVTAMTMNFKIAKESLLLNHEKVYSLLKSTLEQEYPNGYSPFMIRDWPVFIEFRKSPYFKKLKNEHKTEFEEYLFSDDNSKPENCDSPADEKKPKKKKFVVLKPALKNTTIE